MNDPRSGDKDDFARKGGEREKFEDSVRLFFIRPLDIFRGRLVSVSNLSALAPMTNARPVSPRREICWDSRSTNAPSGFLRYRLHFKDKRKITREIKLEFQFNSGGADSWD